MTEPSAARGPALDATSPASRLCALVLLMLLSTGLAGCPPPSSSVAPPCNTDRECPTDQRCVDGLCATFLDTPGDGDGDGDALDGGPEDGDGDGEALDGGPGDGDGDGEALDGGPEDGSGDADGGPRDSGSGDAGASAVCGDGEVTEGEDCDDGNTVDDGNGCSEDCQRDDVCGDGVVQDLFEACEPAPDNCCDSSCAGPAPETKTCRGAAGECDVAERCDGVQLFCPDDELAPADTPCGDDASTVCDAPDTCDGQGSCEVIFADPGSPCGSALTSECTSPDVCDGEGSCLPLHAGDGEMCQQCGLPPCECSTGYCAPAASWILPAKHVNEISSDHPYPAPDPETCAAQPDAPDCDAHNHSGGSPTHGGVGSWEDSEETRACASFDLGDVPETFSAAYVQLVYQGPGGNAGQNDDGSAPISPDFSFQVVAINTGPSCYANDYHQAWAGAFLPEVETGELEEGVTLSVDVTAGLQQLLNAGASYFGVLVKPTSDPGYDNAALLTDFALVIIE